MTRWLVLLCCTALFTIACDDDTDDDPSPTPDAMDIDGGEPEPDMDLEPDAAPVGEASISPEGFRVPIIGPDQTVERTVTITNTGTGPFEVTLFELDASPGFQLLYANNGRRPIIAIDFSGNDVSPYPLVVEAGATFDVILEYRPPEAGMPSGTVTLQTTLPSGAIELNIESVDALGQIAVDPAEVAFGRVPPGETAEQTVTVSNPGQATLVVQSIQLQGDMDFAVTTADGGDPAAIVDDPDGDGEPGLAPGGDFELTVTYSPVAEGRDEAVLAIATDDPERPEVRVPLTGNDTTGCILVTPAEMFTIDYDGATTEYEMTIENCGGQPLTIDQIRFRPGTPPEVFAFAEGSVPEFPATIEPGADPLRPIIVVTPGEPRVYRGAVQISSHDPQQPQIDVDFQAVPPGCGGDGGGDGM